jgi:orotate phosphoribosyltransferase-like protein
VDRARALRLLPGLYGEALRLHAAGVSEQMIANALQLSVEAIPALLEIGEAKLAAVLSSEATTATP